MSLADWEVYKSHAISAVSIETALPLVGAGSLKSANVSGQRINLRLTDAHPRGFLKGKIRTLVHRKTTTGAEVLLYAMASAANMTASSTLAYAFVINASNVPLLRKITSGLSTGTTLVQASALTWNVNTTLALELEWAYDLAQWGGCKLIARQGVATDFSDLATLLDTVDASSPYSTSVGEGPGLTATVNDRVYLWDETTIFELL